MTNNNFELRREKLRIVMLRKGEDFALENVW
jgi:hypothetical protein